MMKLLIHVFLVFTLLITASFADVYMKQKKHTDAFQVMGQKQPAEDVIEEIWMTDQGFRSDNPKKSVIMQSSTGKIIMLDHQQKTYTELSLDFSKNMPQMEGASEEKSAQMQAMMNNMMQIQASVQPTSETKTINGWFCKKYNMTLTMIMGAIQMEIWATEDIQVDPVDYSKLQSMGIMNMPGLQQAMKSIEAESKKIKGVRVLTKTVNQMMGQNMKSQTELLEYKTATAPVGLFNIPAGYTKKSMMDR